MSHNNQLNIDSNQSNIGRMSIIGAIITDESDIPIGFGYNSVDQTNDPTNHATINAIREACRHRKNKLLSGCSLYATREPCPMCAGAIIMARVSHVYYDDTDNIYGSCGSRFNLINETMWGNISNITRVDMNGAGLEAFASRNQRSILAVQSSATIFDSATFANHSLVQLFKQIGHTDKHNNINHTYGELYDEWLSPFKNKKINLLEIGCSLYGGGSLLTFAMFLPHAIVYGLDINIVACLDYVLHYPRIHVIEADAYQKATIKDLGNVKYQVIIDDALHDKNSQILALKLYLPLLTNDGIYVVEDCQQDFIDELPNLNAEFNNEYQIDVFDMRTTPMNDNVLVRFMKCHHQ